MTVEPRDVRYLIHQGLHNYAFKLATDRFSDLTSDSYRDCGRERNEQLEHTRGFLSCSTPTVVMR